MQNYIDAKFRITQNQTPDDAFIFWNDDPIIRQELAKHGLKAHLYPFAAVKEDGAIAYVEDHEVKITEPIAFNMEQEELALTGQQQPVQLFSRRYLGKPCRHRQRKHPESPLRFQGSGTSVGKGGTCARN